ncbi:hypothetical protein SD960_02400 [Flavobacterium sp. MMLR14_040]|uniref:hypothetical protein n=1 Tax=Flavobacterium sp. MMLR14_040 TaxID=3093843 RepID=UPI0029906E70|nr:hypothetical protein [Flavobacterium sp. MMLR14_040]MDW8848929.1 hypothetical protein [Flavobacterium sp. MMLR14_040]
MWTQQLAPIAVEILLCRGSAQKIATDSGKKLQKNNIKRKKYNQKYHQATIIPKTKPKPQNTQPKTPSPYDPQHPYKEPQSGPKDITVKDIEKDLIENDPPEGSQTDMDTNKSDEAQSDTFETIAPEKDDPVRKEFEIRPLGNQELQEDERARDETGHSLNRNTKPSQPKF